MMTIDLSSLSAPDLTLLFAATVFALTVAFVAMFYEFERRVNRR